MSEIENVSKKILDDADKQKEEIIDSANKKAKEIIKEAEEKKEKIISDAKKEASEHYEQVYNMEVYKGIAQMEQKVILKKLDLVDKVVEKSKKSLIGSTKKEYLSYIKNILSEIDIKKGSYLIGNNENVLTYELLDDLMKDNDIEKSEDEPDFDEGLKIFSGNAEYSISFLKAIESLQEDIVIDIASFIFDEEK